MFTHPQLPYKIYFREDGEIKSVLIKAVSMQEVWQDHLLKDKYDEWAMVKDISFNLYHWRDNTIDSKVLIKEMAVQMYVEGELSDTLTIAHPYKPLTATNEN